jgi:hypothetical protein
MAQLIEQLTAILAVLVACFLGPGLAIGFLLRRKRRQRAERRSPINRDLLRSPGHSLRDQVDDLTNDVGIEVTALAIFPLLVLALYLAQGRSMKAFPLLPPLYVLAVFGFLAFRIRKLLKLGHRLDHLRAGYDAELAVGQELDQLMRQGARVFHDFPADNFNIDHVVVAPAGFFAVETKGYTKSTRIKGRAGSTVYFDGATLKFPTWSGSGPLEQAERQAKWLSKWASSAIGEPVTAAPVIALPGWFVERTGRGKVKVLSGREVSALLGSTDTTRLSADLIQRIAHQVEQRCRTVLPSYGREEAESN